MFGPSANPPPPIRVNRGYGVSLLAPVPIYAPPPGPEVRVPTQHPTSFRLDLKLPFAVGTLLGDTSTASETQSPFAPVPQFVIGFQTGRVGLGAGIGFTRLGLSMNNVDVPTGVGGFDEGTSASITDLLFAPTLTIDMFES